LAPSASWSRLAAAVLLAGATAPLIMLATLAVARSKVEGVAAVKLLGLASQAPLASWWLSGTLGWLFAALPTWWIMQALWTSWLYLLGGLAVAAACLVLARLALAKLASI
ncbi:MAG: hypothetical protein ACRDXX_01695, partial [Stackebrandtia sp.]